MPDSDNLQALVTRRGEIQKAMSAIGDFRQGSLTEMYRKCGKPTCHCASEGDPGHGPSWVLTRNVKGKTQTRAVATDRVAEVRSQVATYREFRELIRAMIDISTRICELKASAGAQDEAEKKGVLRPPSQRRSLRRPTG